MRGSSDSQPAFFFDTADLGAIESTWDRVSKVLSAESVRGATTNPDGLAKVGATTLPALGHRVQELCQLMTQIRPGGGAVIYVQQPLSTLAPPQIIKWAYFLSKLGDGITRVCMKIPPFPNAMEVGMQLQSEGLLDVNVTGVADCATALRALSYGPRYVSLIPGRMEERGIDARSQTRFVQGRCPDGSEIISGSMRTVDGLRWVCELGTVPTIGPRVWEQIFEGGDIADVPGFWSQHEEIPEQRFAPRITDTQRKLSEEFFEQMDEKGRPISDEFFDAGI